MQTQIEQQSPKSGNRKARNGNGQRPAGEAASTDTSEDVVSLQLGFYDNQLMVFVGNNPWSSGRDIVIYPDGAEEITIELVSPPGFFASAVTITAPDESSVGPWQRADTDPGRVRQTWKSGNDVQRIELVAMAVQVGGENRASVVSTGETRVVLKPRR